MEYVSVLAGTDPTDRPGCTHPWPAALGRWIHDRVGPATRPRLRALAPAMVGLDGPDDDVRAAVVRCCARLGAQICPESTLFVGLLTGRRGPRRLVELGALVVDVCRAVAVLDPADRDEVLVALLEDTIREVRATTAPAASPAHRVVMA